MTLRRSALIAAGLLAAPVPLWALAAGDENALIVRLFFMLALMFVVGKLAAEGFERIGQPAVLGELLAGVLLGVSVLGVIPTAPEDPLTEVIHVFAEIGVVILLFEIGLETDLKQLLRVGPGAAAVALVGVLVPMTAGIVFWLSPIARAEYSGAGTMTTAIFLGAALTATSVGITARVLQDLQVLHTVEARLVIGAAVIDDILGLVLLGLVAAMAAGQEVTVLSVSRTLGVAVGFVVAALSIGLVVAPRLFGLIDRMQVRGVLLVSAFAFALLVAVLAELAGSAMIVGAFAAGVILSGTNQFRLIEDRMKPVADLFTPVFFLSIGAQFDVTLLNVADPANLPALLVGGSLFAIAVGGKLVAGWAVPWRRFNRAAVGIGMLPRGEVGLIFAKIGLVTGLLATELFGAVILMVIGTTLLAPPLLKWSLGRWGCTPPDASGPEDLASFHRHMDGRAAPPS